MEKVEGSVKNLSEGMFGTYPCADYRYGIYASTFSELPKKVRDIEGQLFILDRQPTDYSDVRDAVEMLSKYIYGEYPHREFSTSVELITEGSLKKQVEDIKTRLRRIEILL